jgi:hypothetical protein
MQPIAGSRRGPKVRDPGEEPSRWTGVSGVDGLTDPTRRDLRAR